MRPDLDSFRFNSQRKSSMSPKRSRFPSSLKIYKATYEVKFSRDIENDLLGMCDKTTNTILIRTGQTPHERFMTLIHEVIHAFEFEYMFDITSRKIDGGRNHAIVEQLEVAFSDFLIDNRSEIIRLLSIDD